MCLQQIHSNEKVNEKKTHQDTWRCVMQSKNVATQWYWQKKNNDTIFTCLYLHAAFTKLDEFCNGNALHLQQSIYQSSA